jgi:hypothetical protein
MANKLHTTADDRLLQARSEGLKAQGSPLRPLGKLWGMDVFTWLNPTPGVLLNTMQSFPFKIVWMAGSDEVNELLNEDISLLNNIDSIVTYDASVFSFKDEWLDGLINCAGTDTVVDAFYFVDHLKAPKKILLFTASGEEVIEKIEKFENFIQLMRS